VGPTAIPRGALGWAHFNIEDRVLMKGNFNFSNSTPYFYKIERLFSALPVTIFHRLLADL